jgi:hypothetical protein
MVFPNDCQRDYPLLSCAMIRRGERVAGFVTLRVLLASTVFPERARLRDSNALASPRHDRYRALLAFKRSYHAAPRDLGRRAAGAIVAIEQPVSVSGAIPFYNCTAASVTFPNRARNKIPGTSGSRRSDDFSYVCRADALKGSVCSCFYPHIGV